MRGHLLPLGRFCEYIAHILGQFNCIHVHGCRFRTNLDIGVFYPQQCPQASVEPLG